MRRRCLGDEEATTIGGVGRSTNHHPPPAITATPSTDAAMIPVNGRADRAGACTGEGPATAAEETERTGGRWFARSRYHGRFRLDHSRLGRGRVDRHDRCSQGGGDRLDEDGGGPVTILRPLGHGAANHRVHSKRRGDRDLRGRRRLGVQHLMHDRGHAAVERALPGQQLIQQHAGRIDVGALIDHLAHELLR